MNIITFEKIRLEKEHWELKELSENKKQIYFKLEIKKKTKIVKCKNVFETWKITKQKKIEI